MAYAVETRAKAKKTEIIQKITEYLLVDIIRNKNIVQKCDVLDIVR